MLNILLLVVDQERAGHTLPGHLSLPGHEYLAARGTSFERFHVNALACGPSRSVMYTGQHVVDTGVFDNPGNSPGRPDLNPLRTPTLGHHLQSHGYYTAYKGKWHLSRLKGDWVGGHEHALQAYGFDEWHRWPDFAGAAHDGFTRDQLFTADAARWLRESAPRVRAERPWLLCVNLINPHDVMFFDATNAQSASQLRSAEVDRMVSAPQRAPYLDDLDLPLPSSFFDSLGSKPRAHAAFVEHSDLLYGRIDLSDEESWRRYQNYYFNCIRDVDSHIQHLLQALADSGQESRTLVVFTSDHGEMGSAHAMRAKGPVIYPEALDVPFIVVHPEIRGGTVTSALGSSIDIVPTLLSLAGLDRTGGLGQDGSLRGVDLSEALYGPGTADPRGADRGNLVIFSAVHASNPLKYRYRARMPVGARGDFPSDFVDWSTRSFYRALCDGRYRFARYFSPADHHTPTTWETLLARNDLELYDTSTDPDCLTNCAARPELHQPLILALNRKLNDLSARELGRPDDGSHLPGDRSLWRRDA